MKKSILIGYQAVIIVAMVILAGYFISQSQVGFAVIYVLLAIAGVFALRSEQRQKTTAKTGPK
jgi:uncharacterized membrane protein YqjE